MSGLCLSESEHCSEHKSASIYGTVMTVIAVWGGGRGGGLPRGSIMSMEQMIDEDNDGSMCVCDTSCMKKSRQ